MTKQNIVTYLERAVALSRPNLGKDIQMSAQLGVDGEALAMQIGSLLMILNMEMANGQD